MTDEEIFKLFLYRCVVCWRPSLELNHIILRSQSKKGIDDWKNKVPICKSCHDAYHDGGVTQEKITALQVRRAEFLWTIGKEQYA